MKKIFALTLAVLMLAAMLTACGSEATDAYNGGMAMDSEMGVPESPAEGIYDAVTDSSASGSQLSDQKLIKTVDIRAETEDMDALLSQLAEQIRSLGGYTEYQNVYNGGAYNSYRTRSAELTVRIPADKLDSFLNHVADSSNVISKTESVDDITLQYVDTKSRMEALQAEHDRLVELMAKAENLSDLLTIEERLTEVRYQLERITSSLRVMDNQVSYATIELRIEEVEVYTEVEEPSVWQRISSGFTGNLQDLGDALVDFFVWVVTYSPQLLIFAGIITLVVWLIRRGRSRRKPPKSPYAPPAQPPENNA